MFKQPNYRILNPHKLRLSLHGLYPNLGPLNNGKPEDNVDGKIGCKPTPEAIVAEFS